MEYYFILPLNFFLNAHSLKTFGRIVISLLLHDLNTKHASAYKLSSFSLISSAVSVREKNYNKINKGRRINKRNTELLRNKISPLVCAVDWTHNTGNNQPPTTECEFKSPRINLELLFIF